jgi:hypothetical protein
VIAFNAASFEIKRRLLPGAFVGHFGLHEINRNLGKIISRAVRHGDQIGEAQAT